MDLPMGAAGGEGSSGEEARISDKVEERRRLSERGDNWSACSGRFRTLGEEIDSRGSRVKEIS